GFLHTRRRYDTHLGGSQGDAVGGARLRDPARADASDPARSRWRVLVAAGVLPTHGTGAMISWGRLGHGRTSLAGRRHRRPDRRGDPELTLGPSPPGLQQVNLGSA